MQFAETAGSRIGNAVLLLDGDTALLRLRLGRRVGALDDSFMLRHYPQLG